MLKGLPRHWKTTPLTNQLEEGEGPDDYEQQAELKRYGHELLFRSPAQRYK